MLTSSMHRACKAGIHTQVLGVALTFSQHWVTPRWRRWSPLNRVSAICCASFLPMPRFRW